ncbi:MAG: FGGY-family carbohydrate kinase [Planctomycetota bacterium]
MPQYFLGIDNGGTVSKAALFTADGREVGVASRKVGALEPHPGHSERDMTKIWRATAQAIREVLAKTGIDPAAIACVSPTGHGNGLYLIDEAGKPVRNAIYSTDERAQGYVDQWRADGVDAKALPKTTQSLWAAQPNALLAWVRDHEPEVMSKARWVLMCKDYVRFRLTGEIRAELTDMSGASLLNVVSGQYDDEVLALFDLLDLKRLLPPMVRPAELCGQVTAQAARETGLKQGTPVAGGMFDIDACALASGIVDERPMSLIAGTWGNNQYVAKEPLVDKDLFMTSCYCIPGYYLMLEGSPTSASNLEWFVTALLRTQGKKAGVSEYELCNELVASVEAEESHLVFTPFLFGSNAHPRAKACLIGLEGWHTRAHVVRAVYEGIVFGHNTHYRRLLKFRRPPEAIRFSGGAARSAVWAQMFSDCFQVPVEIPTGTELGALGAAIAGAVACGCYPGYTEAVNAMTRIARRYEPDPKKGEVFAAKYERYQKVLRALDQLW